MAASTNRFANARTFADLEYFFESATSPENLMADGERSAAEANALYQRLVADYNAREKELQNSQFPNSPMR